MYNKSRINELADVFVKEKTDESFTPLLVELLPMIKIIIMSRYKKYGHLLDDFRQEIVLRLWESRYTEGASLAKSAYYDQYYFMRIRAEARQAFRKLKRVYSIGEEQCETDLDDASQRVYEAMRNAFADPEVIYYLKRECPEDLYSRCRQMLEDHPRFTGYNDVRVEALKNIKAKIEEDFDVRLPNDC